MYICICTGINEQEIRNKIKNGFTTMIALSKELKIMQQCGKCKKDVEKILIVELNKEEKSVYNNK